MKKFNWINVKLIALFGAVIFLYSFTSNRNEHRKVSGPVISFTNQEKLFVTRETVDNLLIQNFGGSKTIAKDKLDLNRLEKALDTNEMIQKAEVFVTVDGILKAEVKQKTPIARVSGGEDSFYIDLEGNRMPLSNNYAARVLLVSGEIKPENQAGFNALLKYIFEDKFLHQNIIGIEILPSGSIKMMNRNYDYEIEFGKTVNIEKKFNNYKAFFQKAVQDSLIYDYKKVNLKFTQQVVCTKN